ncbi:hypothetical protein NDY24_23065 (plasmid) [Xanthomonas hortorum pv. pelargonii]|nr:hypothetical protein NDY24_23065 [Xanthomonas hortorum pv. pelargonii]
MNASGLVDMFAVGCCSLGLFWFGFCMKACTKANAINTPAMPAMMPTFFLSRVLIFGFGVASGMGASWGG